jgi:hypothetical protein
MKKLLLVTILYCSASVFAANWVEVFVSKSTGNAFYVDVDRIKKDKDHTFFWVLSNFTKPVGPNGYLSAKVRWKADCDEKKRKKLGVFIYKKNNAEELLDSFRGFGWQYPAPRTIAHAQLMFVCDRAK